MDLWEQLKEHTQARIGLRRTGHSLSTKDLLDFQLAHARARDAVHKEWDIEQFSKELKALGENPLHVKTKISIREQYLRYPCLGRILTVKSREKLIKYRKRHRVNIAFIATDGLSAGAIDKHMIPFWKIVKPLLSERLPDLKIVLVLAPFGRVALSDDIGKSLDAKLSVILVGERPGLSSAESLGIYLTYHPKPGNSDVNRNCISNVHPPEGLAYDIAAEKLLYLMKESLRLKLSGVSLKEESIYLEDHLTSRLGI